MKILHVITRLGRGGAQRMLSDLVHHFENQRKYEQEVVTLLNSSAENDMMEDLPVAIHSLGMRKGVPSVHALLKLRNIFSCSKPDLIHGWMYHGNVAAVIAAGRSYPVIWGIHHSLSALSGEKHLTRLLIRLGPFLAKGLGRIVYVSKTSANEHETWGYPAAKSIVIPNGFDCDRFQPNGEMRRKIRMSLNLPLEAVVVGHAARYHPMKNHVNLLRAFAIVAAQSHDTYLVMVGREEGERNRVLAPIVERFGLANRLRLLGEWKDMSRFYAALDLYVSSSTSEAFPLVLGEAMACGVPCVATDVGDSAIIVGDTGYIVPPDDEEALAAALLALSTSDSEERRRRGSAARERVRKRFSLQAVAGAYEELYRECFRERRGNGVVARLASQPILEKEGQSECVCKEAWPEGP